MYGFNGVHSEVATTLDNYYSIIGICSVRSSFTGVTAELYMIRWEFTIGTTG